MADDNISGNSYFLMQHHNAPTRLLDTSDGAVTNKQADDTNA